MHIVTHWFSICLVGGSCELSDAVGVHSAVRVFKSYHLRNVTVICAEKRMREQSSISDLICPKGRHESISFSLSGYGLNSRVHWAL